jgi:hypothetical protein
MRFHSTTLFRLLATSLLYSAGVFSQYEALSAPREATKAEGPAAGRKQPGVAPKWRPGRSNDPLEAERAALEAEVVKARAAAAKISRERAPLLWAQAQTRLSDAIMSAAMRMADVERMREALAIVAATRPILTKDGDLTALGELDARIGGLNWEIADVTRNKEDFLASITATKAALERFERGSDPLRWAGLQMNLGLAFEGLFYLQPEAGQDSVEAYRRALSVYSREATPWDWARTQHNLANILTGVGAREKNPRILAEAIQSYEAAAEIRQKDAAKFQWANTKIGMGYARLNLARLHDRDEAIATARLAREDVEAALGQLSAQTATNSWIRANRLRSDILQQLAYRLDDAALILEAAASLERTLAGAPPNTAERGKLDVRRELASARCYAGDFQERKKHLRKAAEQFRLCLSVRQGLGDDLSEAGEKLGNALSRIAKEKPAREPDEPEPYRVVFAQPDAALRLEAADAFRLSVPESLAKSDPEAWRAKTLKLTERLDALAALSSANEADGDILRRYANQAFDQALASLDMPAKRNDLRLSAVERIQDDLGSRDEGVTSADWARSLALADAALDGADAETRPTQRARLYAARIAAHGQIGRLEESHKDIRAAMDDVKQATALRVEGNGGAEWANAQRRLGEAIVELAMSTPDLISSGLAIDGAATLKAARLLEPDAFDLSAQESEAIATAMVAQATKSSELANEARRGFEKVLDGATAAKDQTRARSARMNLSNLLAASSLQSGQEADLAEAAKAYDTLLAAADADDKSQMPTLQKNAATVLSALAEKRRDPNTMRRAIDLLDQAAAGAEALGDQLRAAETRHLKTTLQNALPRMR